VTHPGMEARALAGHAPYPIVARSAALARSKAVH
jgi:hypothetical protein